MEGQRKDDREGSSRQAAANATGKPEHGVNPFKGLPRNKSPAGPPGSPRGGKPPRLFRSRRPLQRGHGLLRRGGLQFKRPGFRAHFRGSMRCCGVGDPARFEEVSGGQSRARRRQSGQLRRRFEEAQSFPESRCRGAPFGIVEGSGLRSRPLPQGQAQGCDPRATWDPYLYGPRGSLGLLWIRSGHVVCRDHHVLYAVRAVPIVGDRTRGLAEVCRAGQGGCLPAADEV